MTFYNPYSGNILVEKLGEIKSRKEISKFLTYLPKLPPNNIESLPRHLRLHLLQDVRDLHVPSLTETRSGESLDLMLRQNYKYSDPKLSTSWQKLYGSESSQKVIPPHSMAMGIVGHSGTGKTQFTKRLLSSYPQVIKHPKFPTIKSQFNQVVWLSVDVPSSGKSEHLAMNLMNAWDHALLSNLDSYEPRFTESLSKNKLDGPRMLNEWSKVASCHFLGVLHLDEAQNFFSIPSLKKRNSTKLNVNSPLQLTIKEDFSLKWMLNLTNTCNLSVVISCTPDGINGFHSRFSNLQRFATYGIHSFRRFESYTDLEFFKVFLPCLFKYQYVKDKLVDIEQVGKVLIQLSGGIQRIIIALWVSAHRVAFEREKSDNLLISDFIDAARIYLAPIAPAIKALNSGEPSQTSVYEDMIGDEGFWDVFWNSVLF